MGGGRRIFGGDGEGRRGAKGGGVPQLLTGARTLDRPYLAMVVEAASFGGVRKQHSFFGNIVLLLFEARKLLVACF